VPRYRCECLVACFDVVVEADDEELAEEYVLELCEQAPEHIECSCEPADDELVES